MQNSNSGGMDTGLTRSQEATLDYVTNLNVALKKRSVKARKKEKGRERTLIMKKH